MGSAPGPGCGGIRVPLPCVLRPWRFGLFVVVAALCSPSRSTAQAEGRPQSLFLDRSYIAFMLHDTTTGSASYYTPSDQPLIFEALLSPNLHIRRGIQQDELRNGTEGLDWSLSFTPQVRLRQLGGFSSPLRSPSFLPKFTLQAQRVVVERADPIFDEGLRKILGVQFIVGHHSNGGPGCTFADEEAVDSDGNPVCQGPSGVPANQREIVFRGGSFTTNFLELAVHHRWAWLRSGADMDDHWDPSLTVGFALQWHPADFPLPLPPGGDRGFLDLYGPLRPRIEVEGSHTEEWLHHRLRWALELEYRDPSLEIHSGADRWSVTAEIWVQGTDVLDSFLPEDIGFGLRYYEGQDYYNLSVVRDVRRLDIHMVWDIDGWDSSM